MPLELTLAFDRTSARIEVKLGECQTVEVDCDKPTLPPTSGETGTSTCQESASVQVML